MQSPYADLRGSRTVNDPDATNLMAILLAGSNAPLPVEHAFMPPFARGHSDDELAAVVNFVNGFFGNGTAQGHRGRHRQGAQGAAVVTRRMVSHVRQVGNLNLKSALRRLRGTHIRMRAGATQDT